MITLKSVNVVYIVVTLWRELMSEVKLNREIHNVVVLNNEWMCNEHPDTPLEFHHMSSQYEYYACPKCGNYIKVD